MKYRDLTLISWDEETYLVVTCDSSGGIGDKQRDSVPVSPRILGFHTAQVALLEMLSVGVSPLALCNTLSVEMHPSGEEILKGIHDALSLLENGDQVEVTGSTEENIAVSQTGLGITVMGKARKKDFLFPETSEGDQAVVIGMPLMGGCVLEAKPSELFGLKTLQKLQGKDYIHEVIPAGSQGIIQEIRLLEKRTGLVFLEAESNPVDLHASSGPATSALITLDRGAVEKLRKDAEMPVYVVGEFVRNERS
ncbi:selenophosphate synthase [Proteiniclasticum sp. SCR006]|uniref:Selenophosphate synthase n=1 Tax=Proteiniclasticum aestuarii TaxID=2817862 RepID=A0A939KI13_9CLOT|nr:selenophosphate synthase [Proteiniclasticum aestuarii]MBO1263491.1 selenophosphate synthase [Proteiniclasticum aestuarii]